MTIKRIEGIRGVLPPNTGIMDFARQLITKYERKAIVLHQAMNILSQKKAVEVAKLLASSYEQK